MPGKTHEDMRQRPSQAGYNFDGGTGKFLLAQAVDRPGKTIGDHCKNRFIPMKSLEGGTNPAYGSIITFRVLAGARDAETASRESKSHCLYQL